MKSTYYRKVVQRSYVDTAGMLYKVRNVRVCHLNKAIKLANQTEIALEWNSLSARLTKTSSERSLDNHGGILANN